MDTNNSMIHPAPEQKAVMQCAQPQLSHPTNKIQTSFDALCVQEADHASTDTQVTNLSIGDTKIATTLQLSNETSAVPTAVVLYKKIGDENIQEAITEVGQQTECDIDRQIVAVTRLALPKRSSAKSEREKLQKEMKKFFKALAQINEEKSIEYDLEIPKSFTEFNFDGRTIPVHIDQFYNVPLLGQGAFGKVYAVDIEGLPDNRMAVKCVSRSKHAEMTTMKSVATGKCPYIVRYYCALSNPGTDDLFICMEHMNASIEAFYHAMHFLSGIVLNRFDGLVRRIAHDIVTGLEYLEREKIIHQDVKPANMLINENTVIKLCDFGISQALDALKSNLELVGGTANYAPPERALSIQDDMWALGISLYEVVDGKHPFATDDSYGKFITIANWQPSLSVLTAISINMQQLISHLLEREAQLRPRSYSDILKEQTIVDVTETPSDDECEFVRHVIEKIPRTSYSS